MNGRLADAPLVPLGKNFATARHTRTRRRPANFPRSVVWLHLSLARVACVAARVFPFALFAANASGHIDWLQRVDAAIKHGVRSK
jgi:hypothetical protein